MRVRTISVAHSLLMLLGLWLLAACGASSEVAVEQAAETPSVEGQFTTTTGPATTGSATEGNPGAAIPESATSSLQPPTPTDSDDADTTGSNPPSGTSTDGETGETDAAASPYIEVDFGLMCRTEEVNGFSAQELGFTAASDPATSLDLFVQSSDLLAPRPTQEREMISESADQLEFFYRRADGSPDVYLRVDLEGTTWVVREFASCGF